MPRGYSFGYLLRGVSTFSGRLVTPTESVRLSSASRLTAARIKRSNTRLATGEVANAVLSTRMVALRFGRVLLYGRVPS
jgi:hypothetical protein